MKERTLRDPEIDRQLREFNDAVKAAVVGRWDYVLERLAPSFAPSSVHLTKQVNCPLPSHGDTKKNFHFFRNTFDQLGNGICNACGPISGWRILQEVNGWSFVEAINEVGDLLGMEHPLKEKRRHAVNAAPRQAPPPPKPKEDPAVVARKDRYARDAMNRTWQQAVSLDDAQSDVIRRYLANRGLPNLPLTCTDLRAHPGLEYRWEVSDDKFEVIGTFPALLAMFRDKDGRPIALHRIYVDPDGSGKPKALATLDEGKPANSKTTMTIPSDVTLVGGAVKIDPNPGPVLILAEGVETALAVRAMLGLPVWATLTANLLPVLVLPPQVRIVAVFADRDRSLAGETYGEKAVNAFREQGRVATRYEPPFRIPEDGKTVDWADVVKSFGWSVAQRQPFVQDFLASLGKELEKQGMTFDDAYGGNPSVAA
jgi:phage/plasmid primase-like uncharacterized protein